ncbi:2-haloacid dehalogenase [Mycetocola sp. CAN_C7]|uniref:haloacid dehalogenase type II n=1 Tax=Mycetocola sp. CAN_C7 TaxID=2787724 RepID=UPI0018CAA43D
MRAHTQQVIVFDVNETLSDLSPMAGAFRDVGASEKLADAWFATVLRDGFALATVGESAPFLDIAEDCARSILVRASLTVPLEDAVRTVLGRLGSVPLHTDVPDGIRRLHADGHRLFTLSNGSTSTAERLFRQADILSCFEGLLSVDGQTTWKPAAEAYARASEVCGVPLENMMLVAVHPWDLNGAARAGMSTAWVNRQQASFPPYFTEPTVVVSSIRELSEHL